MTVGMEGVRAALARCRLAAAVSSINAPRSKRSRGYVNGGGVSGGGGG